MKILIIDDHALCREGLQLILRKHDPELRILDAATAEEGLALAQQESPLDLILLDLVMPGMHGAASVAIFRREMPSVPIVILSGSDNQEAIRACLREGAIAHVHKSDDVGQMITTILDAVRHHATLPPLDDGSDLPVLTRRQREVLARVYTGESNKQIAKALDMSDNTVRVHLYDIFKILGVKTRTQAAMLAKDKGLI